MWQLNLFSQYKWEQSIDQDRSCDEADENNNKKTRIFHSDRFKDIGFRHFYAYLQFKVDGVDQYHFLFVTSVTIWHSKLFILRRYAWRKTIKVWKIFKCFCHLLLWLSDHRTWKIYIGDWFHRSSRLYYVPTIKKWKTRKRERKTTIHLFFFYDDDQRKNVEHKRHICQ